MSKKSNTLFYTYTPQQLFIKIRTIYLNKYYNLYMNSMEWTGIEPETEDYIMRQLWSKGTVAAWDYEAIEDCGFAPYSVFGYGYQDVPTEVQLINTRNVPGFPKKNLIVNKDVVLGYFQRNHKPVQNIVEYYVDRMTQVEMVINTNLELHKMPYLIGIDETDKTSANNVIQKILNNELVVFANLDELNIVKTLVNNTPYIIDKLYAYKNNLESELLTFLGLDNSQVDVDKLAVDQINANNQLINSNAEGYEKELNKFCKKIKEVLGYDIGVKKTSQIAQSVHQDMDHSNSNMEDKNETGGTL